MKRNDEIVSESVKEFLSKLKKLCADYNVESFEEFRIYVDGQGVAVRPRFYKQLDEFDFFAIAQ